MYCTWKIINNELVFSCGCKFKVKQTRDGHFPLIHPGNPYKDWNLECEATKMLLGEGNTVGVFQLESNLGRHWCKRLKPENYNQMSALVAILRPSCLNAKNDKGISTTELYCRYKNSEEVATPLVPEIGYLLEDNYYQMLYQEDAMKIARDIAGFDGPQCNNLIKTISKKKADQMAELKKDFLDGCKKTGKVSEEKANLIFENVEASQRYSFCAAHSHAYGGITSLVTAFAKAHFPEYFYQCYLEGAQDNQDPLEERYKLIQDAKYFNIKVTKPELSNSKNWFSSPEFKKILFGLNSVKHVGEKTIQQVKEFCEANKDKWLTVLVKCLFSINSKAADSIIKAGIIDNGMARKRQLHELNTLYQITAKGQIQFIMDNCENYTSLKDILEALNKPKREGGGLHSLKDIPKINGLIYTLDNPGYSLDDSPEWISSVEEEILGISLSANLLQTAGISDTNTTCKDIQMGKNGYGMTLAVEINRSEERQIKTGKNKGKTYLKIDFSDNSGTINGVMVWPEVYEKYGYLLKENNTVNVAVNKDRRDSIIISSVFQI